MGVAGQHDRGIAIGDDRGTGVARAEPARRHHRYRDHACDQAAEKGDDEFEAGREHQHGAIARLGPLRELRRERLRRVMQFTEGESGFFGAAIAEENVGRLVRLGFRAPCEQGHQRGKGLHIGIELVLCKRLQV